MPHRFAVATRAFAGFLLLVLAGGTAVAQDALKLAENRQVLSLEFRPGSRDELLLVTRDYERKMAEAIWLRVGPDGVARVLGRFENPFAAATFFDADRLISIGDDGALEIRDLRGGESKPFARVPPAGDFGTAGLAVSRERGLVAVRQNGQPIRLFDAAGKPVGEPIATACSDGECFDEVNTSQLIFAAGGTLLIGTDAAARPILQRIGGARLAVAPPPAEWHSLGLFVIHMALSPDGRALALGYMGMPGGGADIRDLGAAGLTAPRRVRGPFTHADPSGIAGFGQGFVFASRDRLRFLKPDGTAWRNDVEISRPTLLAASASGDRLAVLAQEGLVLFDAAGERLTLRPFAEFGVPGDVAALPDGRTIVTLSDYGWLRFWTLEGALVRPAAKLWAEADAESWLYGPAGRLLLSPDRAAMAVVTPNRKLLRLDATGAPQGEPIALPNPGEDNTHSLDSVALGRDRLALPDAGRGFLLQRRFDGTAIGGRIGPHQYRVVAAAFSPDGTQIATFDGASLRLWSTETGQSMRERRLPPGRGSDRDFRLVFAPDGRTVAVVGDDDNEPSFALWNLAESEPAERRAGRFLRFLPDGAIAWQDKDRLLVAAPDGRVRADAHMAAAKVLTLLDDGSAGLAAENGVTRTVRIEIRP